MCREKGRPCRRVPPSLVSQPDFDIKVLPKDSGALRTSTFARFLERLFADRRDVLGRSVTSHPPSPRIATRVSSERMAAFRADQIPTHAAHVQSARCLSCPKGANRAACAWLA